MLLLVLRLVWLPASCSDAPLNFQLLMSSWLTSFESVMWQLVFRMNSDLCREEIRRIRPLGGSLSTLAHGLLRRHELIQCRRCSKPELLTRALSILARCGCSATVLQAQVLEFRLVSKSSLFCEIWKCICLCLDRWGLVRPVCQQGTARRCETTTCYFAVKGVDFGRQEFSYLFSSIFNSRNLGLRILAIQFRGYQSQHFQTFTCFLGQLFLFFYATK